ncbi:MAG: Hemolysin, contains domain [Verrucomicrobiales bacterium]|nr:Hemolysin, contains domain [Verrucomicrobiales bacterium]
MNVPFHPPSILLAETLTVPPTNQEIAWQMLLVFLLVLLKGVFVAAEFALVKVRASQIDELVQEGKASSAAMRAKGMVHRLEDYVGATQFGITLTSIALSMFGERYIVAWLGPKLTAILSLPESVIHIIAFILVLVVLTFVDVVFGELMPKSVAIRRSLGTTLQLSGPLSGFEFIFRYAIRLLNGSANWIMRVIFRIEPDHDGLQNIHSAEELQILVAESQRSKQVTATERDISINALELSELTAHDVMTPRTEIIAIDPKEDFQSNLKMALESKHTRFPLREKNLDHCLGVVHVKDFFRIINDPKPDLTKIRREIIIVPETQALDELLKTFLSRQAHMALVVDEFGATVGMVTLEDVLEELVGEIQDEFDTPQLENGFDRLTDDEFEVDGKMPLYELAEHTDLELQSEEVSSIGGYITSHVGHLPGVGETAEIDGYEVTVREMDGRRILRLHFKRHSSVHAESPSTTPAGETAGA